MENRSQGDNQSGRTERNAHRLGAVMTPREITEVRDAAREAHKLAERFGSDSTPYFVLREAGNRLYEIAKHFEGRNLARSDNGE